MLDRDESPAALEYPPAYPVRWVGWHVDRPNENVTVEAQFYFEAKRAIAARFGVAPELVGCQRERSA